MYNFISKFYAIPSHFSWSLKEKQKTNKLAKILTS